MIQKSMLKRFFTVFLASVARRAIRHEKPTIVAITGSYGKSSAKEAIATAMGAGEAGSVVRASIKNYNNQFGVPFTIFSISAPGKDPLKWLVVFLKAIWIGWGFGKIGAETLILEMGADRPGDLDWLVRIAPPNVSVITAVAECHSEYFGSLDDIAKEKGTLVRALKEKGIAILNNDDPRVTAMRREFTGEAKYFGFSEGADVRVLSTELFSETDERGNIHPMGIEVVIEVDGKNFPLRLHGTIGRPQALACASAIAVSRVFGITVQQAIERLERDYHGIAGRTRVIPGIKYTTIIDDSYNAASPNTVISAINDMTGVNILEHQRRIVALGDMRELGEYSDAANASVGKAVAEGKIDVLVVCGTLGAGIADSAIANGMNLDRVFFRENSADAGLFLQEIIEPGDVILVKGSQGSRMEKVVKELMANPLEAPFLLVRMNDEWQKIG